MDNFFQDLKVRPDGIDFMPEAWLGCVSWAIGKPEMREQFKQDTGLDLSSLVSRDPISAMIDRQTGRERDMLLKFCDWVTENIWGAEL